MRSPVALEAEVGEQFADPGDVIDQAEQRAELAALTSAIADLPPRQREAIALRDFLLVTRGVNHQQIEHNRMQTIQNGYREQPKGPVGTMVYTTIQELATRVSHFNTGQLAKGYDRIALQLLELIAKDENHHMLFYRGLVAESLLIAPSDTVEAICREVINFKMPGEDMVPGFARASLLMAQAGIYNLTIHLNHVVLPLLRFWKIFDVEGLNAQAEQARRDLSLYVEQLTIKARQQDEHLQRRAARLANRGALAPAKGQ